MTIYENLATEAIASFFHHEPLWKKEILFGFLLQPFGLSVSDIIDVVTQDKLKDTIPDFTIRTAKRDIKFEVKINDTGLTEAELTSGARDVFLVRKTYANISDIPVPKDKILFWENLFDIIDKKGAMKDFVRLSMVREYMKEPEHTLLLSPLEVAMLYSPKTIYSVYSMSEKLFCLCENFLDSHEKLYKYEKRTENMRKKSQNNQWGIGYYFEEINGKKRSFFIGLSPAVDNKDYYYSIALKVTPDMNCKNYYADDEYAYFPLDKEILARCTSEEDLQAEFNKNVEEVLKSIN